MCLDVSEKSQKTKLGLLELELQVTESPDGVGNQTGIFWNSSKISLTAAPSLQPFHLIFDTGSLIDIELNDPTGPADQ